MTEKVNVNSVNSKYTYSDDCNATYPEEYGACASHGILNFMLKFHNLMPGEATYFLINTNIMFANLGLQKHN